MILMYIILIIGAIYFFGAFFKKISIPFGYKGYLYINGKLDKIYEVGNYIKIVSPFKITNLYYIPENETTIDIRRQEVLTKDNISLKLNVTSNIKINNPELFIKEILFKHPEIKFGSYEIDKIYTNIKIFVREVFLSITSTNLLENNKEIFKNIDLSEISKKLEKYGVSITSFDIVDIMFPKAIQQLYAKVLDAELRGKYDLENARSLIASLRAMKNASKMIESDPNLKFILYLETLQKISKNNSSTTLVLGEIEKQLNNKN